MTRGPEAAIPVPSERPAGAEGRGKAPRGAGINDPLRDRRGGAVRSHWQAFVLESEQGALERRRGRGWSRGDDWEGAHARETALGRSFAVTPGM